MTTEVEIRANHGWPVRVTLVTKSVSGTEDPKPQSMIIPAGERRSLYVHSHLDLIVHEIQPDEEGFSNSPFASAKVTDKCEATVVQAVGSAEGVAITGEPEVVQRTVTGYIEPITADKITL